MKKSELDIPPYTPPRRICGLDRMDIIALRVWDNYKDPTYYRSRDVTVRSTLCSEAITAERPRVKNTGAPKV